jgi:hypothetical protein
MEHKIKCYRKKSLGAFDNVLRNFVDKETQENSSNMFQYIIPQLSVNKPHFLHFLAYSFLKTCQPSPMNKVKVSKRTFLKLKKGTVKMV